MKFDYLPVKPAGRSVFETDSPRHTTTVILCATAVLAVLFANTFPPLKLAFYGIFVLAMIIPLLTPSRARPDGFMILAGFSFITVNFIVLVMHPLDGIAFYNALLAVACVTAAIIFTTIRPDPGQLYSFIRQLGLIARVLLILGLVGRVTEAFPSWNTETGFLWLLLFFVFIDAKISNLSKFIFTFIWMFNAYMVNDRVYLLVPFVVFIVYFIWPRITQSRVFGIILLTLFFALLVAIPLLYIQLSFSEYREILDQVAIDYTGDRFFSGRDIIWFQLLNDAVNQGIAFGSGHATTPEGLFLHDVSAHNTYVSTLARTGVVGLATLFLVLVSFFVTMATKRLDPVTRWSAAFGVGILFKQSTELSLIGNNVALGVISWLVIAFGIIHYNVMKQHRKSSDQLIPLIRRKSKHMYLGIITYQHTTNFGAALQAYALRKTCEDLGARAEIIDYRSPSMAEAKKHSLNLSSQTWLSRAKLILRKPLFKMKQRSFEKFSSEYMHLTEKTFVDSKQLYEGLPSYDVLIIGSDQVWNHEINGMDSSYFGNFAPSTMRIASYASSIGLTSISPLFQDEYGKGLKRIDPLSVRERSAATIIRNLTGQNAVVHADPVFLRSPAQWRSLAANQPSKAISDALVTYFIGSTGTAGERIIATSDLRMKRRVKLAGGLAMRDLLSPSISVRLDRGPIDFIQAIDNASFVLADSFHATAMSIILDKPFGVLLKGDQGKDARILDILRRFGLQDRVVRSADDLRFGVPSEDVPLEKLLNSTRLDSYDYLKEIL